LTGGSRATDRPINLHDLTAIVPGAFDQVIVPNNNDSPEMMLSLSLPGLIAISNLPDPGLSASFYIIFFVSDCFYALSRWRW
jgi:hypothetical protein